MLANALVDTGSEVTTISELWAKENLNLKELKRQDCHVKLRAVNGLEVPYSGVYAVDLDVFGRHCKNVPALMVKDGSCGPTQQKDRGLPILLGMNVLGLCTDGNPEVPLYLRRILKEEKKGETDKIAKSVKTMTIKADSVMNIQVSSSKEQGTFVAIQRADNLQKGLTVIPTVMSEDPSKRYIRVINTTQAPIIIKRRTPVAVLKTAKKVEQIGGSVLTVHARQIHISKL